MGKAWIESLAGELKEKGREAAESYGREQHRAGIVAAEGKVFFTALVMAIEQDFSEIRSQLQGSAISSDTSIYRDAPTEIRLSRSRFPWFDATLQHRDADIVLEYVQGRGDAGSQSLASSADRKSVHFGLQVDPLDRLYASDSFGEDAPRFDQAEELAKQIVELLLKV